MPFTVEDFRDLLRILDERPEWKREMRRAILTDEVLELPKAVRELTEAQKRTEQRLDTLAARVEELAEAQKRTEARVQVLTAQVAELAQAQTRTEQTVQRLVIDVAELKGDSLERRFRERTPSLVRRPYRRARLVPFEVVGAELDEAADRGTITESEMDEAMLADAIVEARDAEGPLWLAVEVSAVVDARDVERAARRAAILSRTGRRSRPAVAGHRLTEGAKVRLEEAGAAWFRMPDEPA